MTHETRILWAKVLTKQTHLCMLFLAQLSDDLVPPALYLSTCSGLMSSVGGRSPSVMLPSPPILASPLLLLPPPPGPPRCCCRLVFTAPPLITEGRRTISPEMVMRSP